MSIFLISAVFSIVEVYYTRHKNLIVTVVLNRHTKFKTYPLL